MILDKKFKRDKEGIISLDMVSLAIVVINGMKIGIKRKLSVSYELRDASSECADVIFFIVRVE